MFDIKPAESCATCRHFFNSYCTKHNHRAVCMMVCRDYEENEAATKLVLDHIRKIVGRWN